MKNRDKGIWSARLSAEADNPREIAFAEQWRRMQNVSGAVGGNLLGALLYGHGHGSESQCDAQCAELRAAALKPTSLVERDRLVAATLIQWLGSNVGFGFLAAALKRCGYMVVKENDIDDGGCYTSCRACGAELSNDHHGRCPFCGERP